MKPIFAKAPLRLSFAGGGSDIPVFSDKHGGAVVSVAINRFAYTIVENSENGEVELIAGDQNSHLTFNSREELDQNKELPLHTESLRYFFELLSIKFLPIKVTTYCDSPIGAGLGASSTITVSLIYGLSKFFGSPMTRHEVAETAFHVERIRCQMTGGKQDHFSASYGGMNLLEFEKGGSVVVKPIHLRQNFALTLQSCLLTCYSGQSRVSSKIIDSQTESIITNDPVVMMAMESVKQSAYEMYNVLQSADLQGVLGIFQRNWESKKKTSQYISPDELTKAIDKALSFGAWTGKVSGAGGGGFLMFWVPVQKRGSVVELLESNRMTVYNCDFCDSGVLCWS
jgi:D-glycero-alpha-D-manno-heptose-7-phosphate kinase